MLRSTFVVSMSHLLWAAANYETCIIIFGILRSLYGNHFSFETPVSRQVWTIFIFADNRLQFDIIYAMNLKDLVMILHIKMLVDRICSRLIKKNRI